MGLEPGRGRLLTLEASPGGDKPSLWLGCWVPSSLTLTQGPRACKTLRPCWGCPRCPTCRVRCGF